MACEKSAFSLTLLNAVDFLQVLWFLHVVTLDITDSPRLLDFCKEYFRTDRAIQIE